jgi:DNA-directed RNA polymerase
MELVSRFKEIERFYLPWSFDYRGRVYPIPAFLTPQDTDFGKSLLRFADESPMTPDAQALTLRMMPNAGTLPPKLLISSP